MTNEKKLGRPSVYADRKLLTIKVDSADIERLEKATIDKYGTANGNTTKMINDILKNYLDSNGY